jgi:hypothetical protein
MPNLHTLAVGTTSEKTTQKVLTALMDCIRRRCDAAMLSENSTTMPDDVLFVRGVPVVASRAKRVKHSTLFCLPQALAAGADVARVLQNRGVDEPGVPVVLYAGDVVQFAGVFLIPDSFPAFCLLSRPFNLFCQEDLLHLSTWADAVAAHATTTSGLVTREASLPGPPTGATDPVTTTTITTPATTLATVAAMTPAARVSTPALRQGEGLAAPAPWAHRWEEVVSAEAAAAAAATGEPELQVDVHFFKPVRELTRPDLALRATEHRATLVTMMRVYKLLHDVEDARPHVLFPLGVVQMTSADTPLGIAFNEGLVSAMKPAYFQEWAYRLTPVLVYQRLGEEWTDNHPGERRDAYCQAVTTAVAAVTAAGVAMLDLRPPNVMWRSHNDGTVELRLIDFEFVLPEGYLVPAALIKAQAADDRYDVSCYTERDDQFYASTRINQHWLEYIRDWAMNA